MKRQIIKMFFISVSIIVLISCCISCHRPYESDNSEIIFYTQNDKPFKILHFADLHFGVEGMMYHNSDISRSLDFIDYAIKSENPDFIVLLGDNMMSQGVEGAKFIVETFDKYQIPYTYVFGNHDAELYDFGYSKSEVSRYLEDCDSDYLLYNSGYIQNDSENRYGNFSISIKDKKTEELIGAFVIIDTGVYDYSLSKYQSINNGQISWYTEEIERLNNIYKSQKSSKFETIPSITYGHIQLPEFGEAYEQAKNNNGAEFVYEQDLPEGMIKGIADDAGKSDNSFFKAMKRMQSSKAYLCGHMHGLTYHVKKDGIILGFCPQACVTGNASKRISTFSYTISENFEITPKLISEPVDQNEN